MRHSFAIGVLFLVTTAALAERHITRAQLPSAVAETIARETQDDTIKGYATEREHGVQVWEVETIHHGHTRDLQIAADGSLLEVEEEVEFSALPLPVQIGLTTKAAPGKVVKVESLTKRGRLVAYEASTLTAGKHGEVQVAQDGSTLRRSE